MTINLLLLNFAYEDGGVFERKFVGQRAKLDIFGPGVIPPLALARAADAICTYSPQYPVPLTPADYPRARMVIRSGVGYDNVDLAAWGRRGVPVCNVPDYGTSEVADHAIALMLALTRGTATYHDALRSDPVSGWKFGKAPVVRRLRGATFGVLGLGRIGIAAALRARAFGMEIAFHDPYLPRGFEIALGFRRIATAGDLAATSDVLSVHAPLSAETEGLVGKALLARAKPGLVLINTARGPIVDLEALHDALKAGRIGAAALDVMPKEPPDPKLRLIRAWTRRESWLDGRFTMSPHAAFYSPASVEDLRRKTVETAIDLVATGTLANCVNAHVLTATQKPKRRTRP